MDTVKIQNVVTSATLHAKIDLERIATAVEDIEYEPEQFPGLVLRLEDPKTATLVFGSGKLVCTGAKSPEESRRAIFKIIDLLKGEGTPIKGEPEITVQNIVASADLGAELNLDAVVFGLPNCEYEPEQFPGLIYRLKRPKVVLLLFGSGKVVCTGAKTRQDVEDAVVEVKKALRKIGIKV
ncbi:MAG: TATA-box-binding protein [Candidatus Methanofastidiosia archaeon]